jgi:hypothetical protein
VTAGRSFSSSSSSSSLRKKQQQTNLSAHVVKLKQQQSDLKFVFSVKVKEEPTTAGAGRSLLKKNVSKTASLSPSSQPHLLSSSIVSKHKHTLTRRPPTKRQRSAWTAYDSGIAAGGGEYNETAFAVRSLMHADSSGLGKFLPDLKNRKVQIDREIHNSMERQRRIELKNEFESLKSLVPELVNNDKVSKLTVLNVAARYVERLETSLTRLKWRKELLKEKKKQLLERLNILHISSA